MIHNHKVLVKEVLEKVIDRFMNTTLAPKQIAWDLGLRQETVYYIRNLYPLFCYREHQATQPPPD